MADSPRTAHDWLPFARAAVEAAVRDARRPTCLGPPAHPHGGVFITLHKLRALRSCMGTLDAALALPEAIADAAINSTRHDQRFGAVRPGELPDIRVELSILSPHRPLRHLDELELGLHGVLVRCNGRRGLFLPTVALTHGLDREGLLARCCVEKAGLAPDAWRSPDAEVWLFTTDVAAESD